MQICTWRHLLILVTQPIWRFFFRKLKVRKHGLQLFTRFALYTRPRHKKTFERLVKFHRPFWHWTHAPLPWTVHWRTYLPNFNVKTHRRRRAKYSANRWRSFWPKMWTRLGEDADWRGCGDLDFFYVTNDVNCLLVYSFHQWNVDHKGSYENNLEKIVCCCLFLNVLMPIDSSFCVLHFWFWGQFDWVMCLFGN